MDNRAKEFLKNCDYQMKQEELVKEAVFFRDYGEKEYETPSVEKEEEEPC